MPLPLPSCGTHEEGAGCISQYCRGHFSWVGERISTRRGLPGEDLQLSTVLLTRGSRCQVRLSAHGLPPIACHCEIHSSCLDLDRGRPELIINHSIKNNLSGFCAWSRCFAPRDTAWSSTGGDRSRMVGTDPWLPSLLPQVTWQTPTPRNASQVLGSSITPRLLPGGLVAAIFERGCSRGRKKGKRTRARKPACL